jgi:DNA-binding transcriptional ArsR family regulator
MPDHSLAVKQLAELLGIFSHPNRIRIIEVLSHGEKDVNTLQSALGIAHSGVSQHLAVLRSHRVVVERRAGRHVYYRLVDPALSQWLMGGLAFLEMAADRYDAIRDAARRTRENWPSTGMPFADAMAGESDGSSAD